VYKPPKMPLCTNPPKCPSVQNFLFSSHSEVRKNSKKYSRNENYSLFIPTTFQICRNRSRNRSWSLPCFYKLYNCYSFIDQLDSDCFKFFVNNLITNEFDVWNYVRYNVERCLTALFDLLITGRKQFKNISYYQLDPRLYHRIIEVNDFLIL